jgi:hypothetical protein
MTAHRPGRAAFVHLAIAVAAIGITVAIDPDRLARIGAFGIAASLLLLACGPWLAAAAARDAARAGIRVPPLWSWRWNWSSTDPADRAFRNGYCADVIVFAWIAIAGTVVLRDGFELPPLPTPDAWLAWREHWLVDGLEGLLISAAICGGGWLLTARRAACSPR